MSSPPNSANLLLLSLVPVYSVFMNDWIATWGPAKAFNCIGGIMLALTATTVLVYVYGKRHRTWWYSRLNVKME